MSQALESELSVSRNTHHPWVVHFYAKAKWRQSLLPRKMKRLELERLEKCNDMQEPGKLHSPCDDASASLDLPSLY